MFQWTIRETMLMADQDQAFDRCGNCGAMRQEHTAVLASSAPALVFICPGSTWKAPDAALLPANELQRLAKESYTAAKGEDPADLAGLMDEQRKS
jgi:hypothetical protein